VAVKGNGRNEFGLHENTARCQAVTFKTMTRCETSFNLPNGQLASVSSVSERSNCKLLFFTAMSVDSVKKIFNYKLKELNDASIYRSLLLEKDCYNNVLQEV
jgi:hypothetical protein